MLQLTRLRHLSLGLHLVQRQRGTGDTDEALQSRLILRQVLHDQVLPTVGARAQARLSEPGPDSRDETLLRRQERVYLFLLLQLWGFLVNLETSGFLIVFRGRLALPYLREVYLRGGLACGVGRRIHWVSVARRLPIDDHGRSKRSLLSAADFVRLPD